MAVSVQITLIICVTLVALTLIVGLTGNTEAKDEKGKEEE